MSCPQTSLLVEQVLNHGKPARACARRYNWPEDHRRVDAISLHQAADAMHAALAAESTSTHYIDATWMHDKLCDANGKCGPTVPGSTSTYAWLDTNHLSTAGSLYLAPFFNCFLQAAGMLSPP